MKKTLLAAGLSAGLVLWWACRGHPEVPKDLVPGETRSASESASGQAEFLWGGWHSVPWDTDFQPTLERAYRLQLQGRREEAVAVLGTGLGQGPPCATLFEARGALFAAMGYRRAAERDFEEAVELASERPGAWVALARMRQELDLSKKAIEALERARELGCDDRELHLVWARALRQLGRRGPSAYHYSLALERTSKAPYELLVEAATLYSESDIPSPEALNRAMALLAFDMPKDPVKDAQVWLAHDLLRDLQGVPTETQAAGLRALDIHRRSLEAWTDLALVSVQWDDPQTRERIDGPRMAQGDPGHQDGPNGP